MAKIIVVTDGDAVAVRVDRAGGGAEPANEVADHAGVPLQAHGDPHDPSPWDGVEAGRRAEEDAAIDAEDALAQADEANALDPVG